MAKIQVTLPGGKKARIGIKAPTTPWEILSDMGRRNWYNWKASSQPAGALTAVVDSIYGGTKGTWTQSNAALRASIVNGWLEIDGLKKYPIADQGSECLVHLRHLYGVIKDFDYANVPANQSIPFIAFQGITGSATERMASFYYIKSTHRFRCYFGATGGFLEIDATPYAANAVLIFQLWRRNGVMYFQINGSTPLSVAHTILPPRYTGGSKTGVLGNNTVAVPWKLAEWGVVQGEITTADSELIMGSKAWEYGIQTSLPVDHTYRNARPLSAGNKFVATYVGQSLDFYNNTYLPFWNDAAQRDQFQGQSLAATIAGWEEVYRVDNPTVVSHDADIGAGDFFAPLLASVGSRVDQKLMGPSDTPSCYTNNSGNLECRMIYSPTLAKWCVPVFGTINRDGRGRTWCPDDRPTYIEFTIRNGHSGVAAWNGAWAETVNRWGRMTRRTGPAGRGLLDEPYQEMDCPEIYAGQGAGSDDKNLHITRHHHASAWRAGVNGFPLTDRHAGDTVDVGIINPGQLTPYDDQFHTMGTLINRTHFINHYDVKEVNRGLSDDSMYGDEWCGLFDCANWNVSAALTPDTHVIYIKTFRVLQGTYP